MLRHDVQGNATDVGNNNSGVIGETVHHLSVEGGNGVSVQGNNNSIKVYLDVKERVPGELMDQEKWKELIKRVEKLVAKDEDISDDPEEQQTSDELELPVDKRRLVIYTGIDIAKKKLKTTVEIVFTLTPVGLAPGGQPWATIVWRVLRFQPSVPIRHELTWHDQAGFCDVVEENDSTIKPGDLSAVVKPKHMAILRDIEENPDFSTQISMKLETADIAVINKLDSSQRLALCSIDCDRTETDQFSPVIDLGSIKSDDIRLCGPPVMLQAYAVRGHTERRLIKTATINRALFVDKAGKQKPVDIRTLRASTTFRLYSNNAGKIILEAD